MMHYPDIADPTRCEWCGDPLRAGDKAIELLAPGGMGGYVAVYHPRCVKHEIREILRCGKINGYGEFEEKVKEGN